MGGRARSRPSGGETPENHRDVVLQENLRNETKNLFSHVVSVKHEQEPTTPEVPPQSDDLDIKSQFIFAKQNPDGEFHLEMDPLKHYDVLELPETVKSQMKGVYNECLKLLLQLPIDRVTMISRSVRQVVDGVMDNELAKSYHKPPYTKLINHILDRNITVKKEHFLYPEYTFHTVRVGAMDSLNLVEKVYFLKEMDFTICQRLSQIKDFTDRFGFCNSLEAIIRKMPPVSSSSDSEEIGDALSQLLKGLLNNKTNKECFDACVALVTLNTDAARFIKRLDNSGAFILWFVLIGSKGPNVRVINRVLTHHFGQYKKGIKVTLDKVMNDFFSSEDILTSIKPIKVTSKEQLKRADEKPKTVKTKKAFQKRGRNQNDQGKGNFVKKAKGADSNFYDSRIVDITANANY